MKKYLLVIAALGVILVGLVAANYAMAQQPTPQTPYGPGLNGARGGMMGGFRSDEGYGVIHDAMQAAMAEALGVTPEELAERHAAGDTAWTIAQEKGMTEEEFTQKVTEARSNALAKLVEDGVITQEQADWMLQRMGSRFQNGFGDGTGTCMGGGLGGRRGMGRWNTQP